MAFNLDSASRALTLVSLVIAALAAWKALPLDAELKELQARAHRLELDLRVTESTLKETESKLKEVEATRRLSLRALPGGQEGA